MTGIALSEGAGLARENICLEIVFDRPTDILECASSEEPKDGSPFWQLDYNRKPSAWVLLDQKSPDGGLQRSKMGKTQAIAANVLYNTK